MASFEFEGDTKDISARQLEFIGNILSERGFENGKVAIEPVGKAGDNFVANVKRIIINKDGNPFKMIGKIAPGSEHIRKTLSTPRLFSNEHFMYTTVLPKFTELEKQADVPESERLKYAACYGSLLEEPNEVILLEDLNESNFIMFDKFNSLTSESVMLVLRSFTILHSLSYVLKYQEPETFDRFSSELLNLTEFTANMPEMKMYMDSLEGEVISLLDNNAHKKLIKGKLTDSFVNMLKILKFYKESKSSVIQQGDAWTNNIMFRLDGEKVVECCMIDYQVSNHTSPVADINYMIFNCTDYETRFKHYHEWIDYYHNELDKRLNTFGLKVNDIYTRERLDADLRRQAKLSFGQSIMIASMLMREHHEAAKFKEAMAQEMSMDAMTEMSKLGGMEASSMGRFKDKVNGLIKSFTELGHL